MGMLCQFLPAFGAITVASIVATGDIEAAGKVKALKFRASATGSAADVRYGYEIAARVDNDRNGWYMDSANDDHRLAANGALIFVGSGVGVVAIATFTANNGMTVDGGDLTMATGRAIVLWAGTAADCSWQWPGDPNTGAYYASADRYELAANGGDTMSIRNQLAISYLGHNVNTLSGVSGSQINIGSGHNIVFAGDGYIEMEEMVAPGAPAADRVRIYAVVDGGAKTDLAATFQSGAAQVFAQEP